MKRWKALTTFEIGILVLSAIATLAWVYLVCKIAATLDTLQKGLQSLFAGNITMG